MKLAKEQYISIREIVKQAKSRNVDFGKFNPYNRLRYYTKIGLLPNMVRIKSQGHYPEWAVDRLVRIENYKKQGWDNEKILEKFKKEKVTIPLDPISNKKWIWYFLMAFFVSLFTLGIIQTAFIKKQVGLKSQIAGNSVVLSGNSKTFVFDNKVTSKSKIFVTFFSNYQPATSYYISSLVPNLGFELSLSSPISQSAKFNYRIVE